MLKKVFKYEWKSIWPLLLSVHGIGLVIAIFCRIGISLMGGVEGSSASIMAILLLFAAIMAIGCIVAYTYFYGGYRFYKSVFTQQGYLTNTLPVTADQLIWGKGLTMIIWIILDFLWALAAIFILVLSWKDLSTFFRELPNAIAALFRPEVPATARLTIISVLLTPFFMVIQIYVSAAIGNLFTGHKLLATIGVFIGINFIQQILGLFLIAIASPYLSQIGNANSIESASSAAFHALNLVLTLSLIFYIACSVVFYFLCRYVLNHKLNLE